MKTPVRIVSLFLSVVMTLTAPLGLLMGKETAKLARAKEDCRVSFAAISDIHMRGNYKLIFRGMLELGLLDMERAQDKLDAVAFVGDVTNHGYVDQWDAFADSVRGYDIAENTMVVVGNHDTWGPNRDEFDDPEDGVKATFIRYNKTISGRDITEMYYSDIINGYPFIALGSETDSTSAYLSDTQLAWFAREMEKAAATGKPIFVFMHQPINQTHGLPYVWDLDKDDPPDKGGVGDQSAALAAILKKYDNVFYISGHLHAGYKNADSRIGPAYACVETMENDNGNPITLINLPSYMYFDLQRGGHIANGCGWVVEVYDGEVLLRARNFAAGTWITRYDRTVPLVG
ncbi:MAG: metallophosphoesterase [Lentisphaeria bacterium]|nr:metallophosphoesterase [Lentisphaeria bacterium]